METIFLRPVFYKFTIEETNFSDATDKTAIMTASVLTPRFVQMNTCLSEAPSVVIVPAPTWLLNKIEEEKHTQVAPKHSKALFTLGFIPLGALPFLRSLLYNV